MADEIVRKWATNDENREKSARNGLSEPNIKETWRNEPKMMEFGAKSARNKRNGQKCVRIGDNVKDIPNMMEICAQNVTNGEN